MVGSEGWKLLSKMGCGIGVVRCRRVVVVRVVRLVFALLVSVTPAFGSEGETGGNAEAPPVVSVWYRSSAECPEATSFLERVTRRGTQARLAGVGDAVDFVVTIGVNDGTSAGRLERQTSRGTIAIRELSAPDCKEVADALAFSLALAARELAGENASEAPSAPAVVVAENATESEPTRSAPPKTKQAPPRDSDEQSLSATEKRERPSFALGGGGAIATGLGPSVAPGFELFAGYEIPGSGLFQPSLRLSAVAFRVGTDTGAGDMRVSVIAGRAQGCPLAFDAFSLRTEACVAFELGQAILEATEPTSKRETRTWAAGVGLVRVRSRGTFFVEGSAAGMVPFIRYHMTYEDSQGVTAEYTTALLGLQAGLGVGGRLP